MESLPRILVCGDILWSQKEAEEMFADLATITPMGECDRPTLLADLKTGGRFESTVALYHRNYSVRYIGLFDTDFIRELAAAGIKWIAHVGAGYDKIDVAACKEHDIGVSNTPHTVDDATATTALYLLIASARQFTRAQSNLRAGLWKTSLAPAHDPSALTVAILGLGGIGLHFARLVRALAPHSEKKVLYHSRKAVLDAPEWCEFYPKERLGEMLGMADVLSIHVPLNEETRNIVGEREIRALRQGAIIVNTARGGVLDEEALIRALEDAHISAAGLDVFPDEPNVNPRLLEFPQLTLLPHAGTNTVETARIMEVRALQNLHDFLVRGVGADSVPELRN